MNYNNFCELSNEQKIVSWVDMLVPTWERQQVTFWAIYVGLKYKLKSLNDIHAIFSKLSGKNLCDMLYENFLEIISDNNIAKIYFYEIEKMKFNQNINKEDLKHSVWQAFHNLSWNENNNEFDAMSNRNEYGSDDFNFGIRIFKYFKGNNLESDDKLSSNSEISSSCEDEIDNDELSRSKNNNHKENQLLNCFLVLFRESDVDDMKKKFSELVENNDFMEETCGDISIKEEPSDLEINFSEKKRGRPKGSKNQRLGQPFYGNVQDNSIAIKGKRGRPPGPPRPTEEKGIKSWQFVLMLLHNPNYYGKIISWVGDEVGFFKFLRPDKVAELWGLRNNNSEMDYEKFSRALRYYYKYEKEYLIRNKERRVYQFGPKALQWWRDNSHLFHNTCSQMQLGVTPCNK